MFLLILVQIYKKNRGKPHIIRNIYREKDKNQKLKDKLQPKVKWNSKKRAQRPI